MAALSLREECGGGAFLRFDRGNACLTLPVCLRRYFEGRCGFVGPRAGGGGVAVQGGEVCTKGSCHTFVLESCQIECVLIGDGPSGRIVEHSRVG